MATRELKVTLETVTPMLMAGIDQNTPELRPPSILGSLRYWLRAALGGVVGNNLEALKLAEAEVFGDTRGTGAVSIRVSQENLRINKFNPLPHKRQRFTFDGFEPEQKFMLRLSQHSSEDSAWLAAISALLQMASIGGLGRRCRRGWGTVRITEVDVSNAGLEELWKNIVVQSGNTPPSAKMWLDYLDVSTGIGQHCATKLCKHLEINPGSVTAPTSYTIAFPKLVSTVITKTAYSSYEEAIKAFHQKEHQFGVTKAFGSAEPRQSSPLWVRVLPVKKPTKGYVLGITFFNTKLTQSNENAGYIKDFLNSWDTVKREKAR